ncbi:Fic/DOC family protein [Sodalis sp. RH15]|jgi:cell filamentation protein|uniref:Fic/DOC family protein n=1 Tax=Sodalis sp. RH15 TaxID=3394330 RepID=UPI0039B4DCDF
MNRYDVSNSEGKFAEGSGEQVLANKLGISNPDEIDGAELVLLEKFYQTIFEEQFPLGRITVAMIKSWHRRWLENIYEWAGQERTVNISKGGFMFAPSAQVPKLLNEFEIRYLAKYTPCSGMDKEHVTEAIAIVHVELILIHPFREGNGRLSRLLADVMAVQGGFNPLDYQSWEQNKSQYISAIHAGMSMNYEPIKYWVSKALENA